MPITEITRRDILDSLMAEHVPWSGRLEEIQFLSRLYDLQLMRSSDRRYPNAAGDIWQHRVNNFDWDDYWIFSDDRFDLTHCDDEAFLRFLCETVHPIVRPEATQSAKLVQLYNECLKADGYQLVEKTTLSGRPVYIGRYVGPVPAPVIGAVRDALAPLDSGYLTQQITRMEAAVHSAPDLAIGTAKELVESCCRTILEERGVKIEKGADLPKLVKATSRELRLTPEGIPDEVRAAGTIKRLLSNLATITQGIAELRNHYGSGHGKSARSRGLEARHAKLAVGAAATLAVFLYETHESRKAKTDPKA